MRGIPFNHARENGVGYTKSRIHINCNNLVHFILWGLGEVDGHIVRPSDVVDWLTLSHLYVLHRPEKYSPKTPTSRPDTARKRPAYDALSDFEKSMESVLVWTLVYFAATLELSSVPQ